uniref:Hypothetical chloroplast RF47 n=1 Tax=Watanabea reniformis TaxID=191674 RepID=A0A097KKB5_9CHLO|nr:hypothetical chloroplast RF47 [Watanabea reniformis]AIT93624.1 hypothetical chloroplast RF47 [Watanabea reniformis]
MLFYSLKTATFNLSIDNGLLFHLYFIIKNTYIFMDNSNKKAGQDMDNLDQKTQKESWDADSKAGKEAQVTNPSTVQTNEPKTSKDTWKEGRRRGFEYIKILEMTDPEEAQMMRKLHAYYYPPESKPSLVMKLFTNFWFLLFTTILFLAVFSYLITFRLTLTIITILVITPQVPIRYYNFVVDIAYASGVFVNYGQAKRFVFRFTRGCIVLYLLLNQMGGA